MRSSTDALAPRLSGVTAVGYNFWSSWMRVSQSQESAVLPGETTSSIVAVIASAIQSEISSSSARPSRMAVRHL